MVDKVQEGIKKAKDLVWQIGQDVDKKTKSYFDLEFTGKPYYDKSGYQLLSVHALIKELGPLEEYILKHLNNKHELNGVKVYGYYGFNFVCRGKYGISDIETLKPLVDAVKEYAQIVSCEEFKKLKDNVLEEEKKSVENSKTKAILELEKIL